MNAPQPEPPVGVTRVRDDEGDEWCRVGDKWHFTIECDDPAPLVLAWAEVASGYSPLTWDELTPPAEPVTGEWVEVDAADVKDGDRVRLGGVEGSAKVGPAWVADGDWSIRRTSGIRVEVWRPAEVTLPLPTEPGPFWGRVRGTYVGWVMRDGHGDCSTPTPAEGFIWHGDEHITCLPIPDDVKEALR